MRDVIGHSRVRRDARTRRGFAWFVALVAGALLPFAPVTTPAAQADPGTFDGVVTLQVDEGDSVDKGQVVATIEAMKMEASITAPKAGTVDRLAFTGTQQVEGGDLVLVLA